MIDKINEVITNYAVLADRYIIRDGYAFATIDSPANVYDAVFIKYPINCSFTYCHFRGSTRSLEEYIDLINRYKLEKAFIISDDIDFITRCPTLKYLMIYPADDVGDGFDYSPLYNMPQIKSLSCCTVYGFKDEFSTCVDCAKINGLESIHVTNSGYKNYETIKTLKSLGLTDYKKTDLTEAFSSTILDTLSIFQSKIKTLEGIQKSPKMQCLYLYYNRSLQDISTLRDVKTTLKALTIENCPKIEDYSVLGELENLEYLELKGNKDLPNLDFLKTMKNLKTFIFSMNVKDGDLTPCLNLSFAHTEKNHKHYNLKNADLPKGKVIYGDENLDSWRRMD